ncbi:hypothetical protein PoB_003825700 [Plakobranchus ocellatus]|uniref:Uncharacterized protein n=1 Tax=Plakobranchus ocellatus TaxID=259542 RepID=A0AAV4AWU8_9GAST|nr:hypothetical protein PoB_003825700 [Plakobranchus ocellatus]
MGRHRHFLLWVSILLHLTVCSLATNQAREARDDDDDDGEDVDEEGLIEQYILAREEVEAELEEFYKTAQPGLTPDPNSDSMLNLRSLREQVKKLNVSPEDLADLLDGDPGLKLEKLGLK